MNFLILASDPKSTGILCQGGEEEAAAMAETGHKPGRGVVLGIPERMTDYDYQPLPAAAQAFLTPGQ